MSTDRNITKVFNFCHFSFEGGGGSKRKLRELSFFCLYISFNGYANKGHTLTLLLLMYNIRINNPSA